MSVKTLQKQLIAAVAMVLVAAIAVSSSTFAWFAANTRVTATGMSVSAQSDSVFLEISGVSDSGTYSTTGTSTIAASLYPTAHEAWSAKADITDFDLNDDSTNDNWYYRYSDDPAVYNSNLTDKAYIGAFTDYVASTTFSVGLHDSDNTAFDLYVSSITFSAANAGIRAVVVGPDGYQEFTASGSQTATTPGVVSLWNSVTHTYQTITVYFYIDGNDSNVYTNNISNLTGSISMTFDCCTVDTIGV